MAVRSQGAVVGRICCGFLRPCKFVFLTQSDSYSQVYACCKCMHTIRVSILATGWEVCLCVIRLWKGHCNNPKARTQRAAYGNHGVCCIYKSWAMCAVMLCVYNPGLLKDNREYIQILGFSWLRLSVPKLALSTSQADKVKEAEPSVS